MTLSAQSFRGLVLATVAVCILVYVLPPSKLVDSTQNSSRRLYRTLQSTERSWSPRLLAERGWSTSPSQTTLLVAGLTVVGLGLRYYEVGAASFWVDELYSVFVRGNQPFFDIIFAQSKDSHPPLYYLLLNFWMQIGSNSAAWVRLLSVIFGTLAIPSLYLLGQTMFDERTGVVAAGLLTVSPFAIYQSQLARMYVLLLLLSILSIWAFWRLRTQRSRLGTASYVVCTVLLLSTHLYAVFVVAAQNLLVLGEWGVLRSESGEESIPLRSWLRLQAVTGILALPLLAGTLHIVLQVLGPSEGYVGWIPQPSTEMIARIYLLYGGLPHFHPFYAVNELTTGSALVVVALFAFSVCLWGGSRLLGNDWYGTAGEGNHQVVFLILLFAMVVVVPIVLSVLITPMFIPRYSVIGLVTFYLILAGGIVSIPEPDVRRILLVVLVLTSAVTLSSYYQAETQEPWEPSLEYIDKRFQPSDSLLINPGWTVSGDPVREYTDIPNTSTVYVPEGVTRNEIRDKLSETGDRVWILSYTPSSTAKIRDKLTDSHMLSRQKQFGIITVYLYTAGEKTHSTTDSKNVTRGDSPHRLHYERQSTSDRPVRA